MFFYLLFEFGNDDIDEVVHRLPHFSGNFRTKHRTAEENGKLHRLDILGLAHHDLDGHVFVEVLIQTLDLLVNHFFERFFCLVVLALVVDTHNANPPCWYCIQYTTQEGLCQ